MKRVFNFSPGPAMLPTAVLERAQRELLDWHGTGMSPMELPHRGADFQAIAHQTETNLRALLNLPATYQIIFLPDGALAQFTMVPLNLLGKKKQADYVDTGIWSHKALTQAKRYGAIHLAASVETQDGLLTVPKMANWQLSHDAAYVHYAPNETIDGVQFHFTPDTGKVPLVGDFSSEILSRPIDISKYGLIYASAQKNMGPAGISVVIIREDLIQDPLPETPWLYAYKTHLEHQSMAHTPPTYSWYLMGLVLEWLLDAGGVPAIAEVNARKAQLLYNCIDQSGGFYYSRVHPDSRSLMNVVYDLSESALQPLFLEEAAQAGLLYLKGHRLRGGVRASIYNAMPENGVRALVDFMKYFMARHG